MFVCESNVINMNFSFLCRLQERSCLVVKVLVENQGQLTASICGSQEGDEDDILCVLNVTLPPRNDNDVQLSLPESLSKCFVINTVTFFRELILKKMFNKCFFFFPENTSRVLWCAF